MNILANNRRAQPRRRVDDAGVEAFATGCDVVLQLLAHARDPVELDVVGNAGDGFFVGVGVEEASDGVGFVDHDVLFH